MAPNDRKSALVVSFSGIDGAGKSTQIAMLRTCLAEAGLSSSLLTFWNDIVVFSGLRERSSHLIFRGEQGVGSPDKPIVRRDKDVQSFPVMLLRMFLYLLDALYLCIAVRRARRGNADVTIFDRYIYDELANLPLSRWWACLYVGFLLRLAPRPDIAYLVDADPVMATKRKPEYPYEFVEKNRAAYLELGRLSGGITVIAPTSIVEAQWRVVEELVKKLPSHKREFFTTAKAFIDS
jgi:thymidylate kinase